MKRPELPRGLRWRGDSIVATFALADGSIERRSLGSASKEWALEELHRFKRQVREGTYEKKKPRVKEVACTVADVWELYTKTYVLQGGRALWRQLAAWKHLKPAFSAMTPEQVTTAQLIDYQTNRKAAGAAHATINRELAALSAAFYRAAKTTIAGGKPMVAHVVVFPGKLTESAPRKGFVTAPQFAALSRNATSLWLRTFIECAHTFGYRRNELLNMRVKQVDFFGGWLGLEHGETKSGEARKVKMTSKIFELMRASTDGKNPDDFVFTREDGSHVRDPRDAWYRLCVGVGLGRYILAKRKNGEDYDKYVGLTAHDFRRTAARNLIRAGIEETVAMKITGHKTREVFKRYNITDETDIAEATRRIELGGQLTTDTKTDTTAENPRSDSSQLPRM